jgi:hypothetical protein
MHYIADGQFSLYQIRIVTRISQQILSMISQGTPIIIQVGTASKGSEYEACGQR